MLLSFKVIVSDIILFRLYYTNNFLSKSFDKGHQIQFYYHNLLFFINNCYLEVQVFNLKILIQFLTFEDNVHLYLFVFTPFKKRLFNFRTSAWNFVKEACVVPTS